LGMTTGAGVISNRILHSSGYNVPEDVVVQFDPSRLTLSEGVKLKLPDGTKRLMTDEDLAAIVEQVEKLDDGTIHAIASRYLSGRPIGPFNYVGRRRDDPNDRIDHRRRRELRGLRLFAAWINHFDVKQHNSLDMFVGDEQAGYVRHYLIDFASTLGAAANGPTPRYGYEFTVDLPAVAGRALALGLHDDAWRYLVLPDQLLEIGYFESERFDGLEFKSLQPNSAFADMTARDGYWAAKIISAFTDEHLRAIVEQAAYHSSDAAEYMSRTLAERRDKIARQLFDLVPPLDFFEIRESKIIFHDLGAERNIYPGLNQTYRTRVTLVDRSGDNLEWSEWDEQATTEVSLSPEVVVGSGTEGSVDIDQFPYLAIEAAVNRGSGWSDSVTAYFVRRDGRVVRIER